MGAMNNYHKYAYFNGEIKLLDDCKIPVTTNALHYGAGVFAGIKIYDTEKGSALFRIDDHLKRMKNSCKILRFPIEFDIEKVKAGIIELARKNEISGTTYVRPLVFRSDTNLSPDINGEYSLVIYMMPMDRYLGDNDGLSVCVSSWQRNSDNALPPLTKATGGYLNSSLAIHDARQAGFDSAILLDQSGYVGEGAVMNIFLVKNGILVTPSLESHILEGITRKTIIEIAKSLGIEVQERTITRTELYNADEAFFCGTAVEIAWCKEIDKVRLTDKEGAVTSEIHSAFSELSKTRPELFTLV